MKHLAILFVTISIITFNSKAQDRLDLLDPRIRDILIQELDGEKAKQHVVEIVKHHRVQASQGYRDAANYILQQLRSYGFSEKDAYIESFKSDGKISYQTWQSPSGWDATDAELSLVEPTQEKIVSFKDIPMSLMTYSNAGDVTAEVVWVGEGTKDEDYKDKKVKGKFVLASGSGDDVHRLAVIKYGAAAVISYLDDKRGKENPDMIRYTGIWPRTEELPQVTFGFNISNKDGEKIKNLILQGTKVILHGKVTGIGLQPSSMEVVVAKIRGNSPTRGELLFSAHLDHPKECANDNASGSAAILDIARTLKQLIDNKKLPASNQSFRFLWLPEWYGTMAYIDAHPEFQGPALNGKILANINMDMVGENLELLHSKLSVVRTPQSVPSCLNDVIQNMTEMVDKMNITTPNGSRSAFNYRMVPYRGGSDHMMFLDRKIPSVMLSHSDYTHHTTYDTPEKVDPSELQRCEMIATSTMWYLANLSSTNAVDLLDLMKTNAYPVFGEDVRKMRAYMGSTNIQGVPIRWAECANTITELMEYYSNAAKSILTFTTNDDLISLTDQMKGHIGKRFDFLYGLGKSFAEEFGYASDYPALLNEQPDERIPIRVTRGPLDFRLPESRLSAKEAEWYSSKEFTLTEDQRFELVNLIDGKRKVFEIRNAYIAEFPPVPESLINRYIGDLVKVGVLKWK